VPGGGYNGRGRKVSVKGRAPRIHTAVDVPARTWPEVREMMLNTINREISHLSLTATKRKLTPTESLQMTRLSMSLARLAPPAAPAAGKDKAPPVGELSDEELQQIAGQSR
jgi:hypothetical protein